MPSMKAIRARSLGSGTALVVTMVAALGVVSSRIVAVASGPGAPVSGEPAPAFSGQTLNGKPVSLRGLEGQVVLLDFWATWCPPCVASLPHLETLHERYRAQGLVVLGINQEPDDVEGVQSFLRQHDVTFPSVRDDQGIAWAYGVYSFPTSVLVGRDQTVVATYRGPPSPRRLEADVRAALAAPFP